MVDNSKYSQLQKYLASLGMTSEAAKIYIALYEHGETTPLLLSRFTGINRTKVYRTIEEMKAKKLVSEEIGEHTTKISPAPADQLAQIVKAKQMKVAQITRDFGEIEQQLNQLALSQSAETRVRYYRGKSGIEQMVWNVLKAKHEVVGYTFRDLSEYVGEKFMGEFVSEFKRRNLQMRDIYGDEYKENNKVQYAWGEHVKSRYLPRTILAIPHQMDIYDEVVSFYSWNGSEVWGTEIYNTKVAQMQKQLFELAWEKAGLVA